MRKVVLYELLSLDGVAEDPDKFVIDWDEEMGANLAAVIATQDAVILGRRSYDEWSEFWPDSEIEPFATFINDVAKYVASSTPLGRQWHNATAIEGGLSSSCRNSRVRLAVILASTPASRSPKRCSQRTPSTKYGSSSHRRSLAVGDVSWTNCRRFASSRSELRRRPAVTCSPTIASRGDCSLGTHGIELAGLDIGEDLGRLASPHCCWLDAKDARIGRLRDL